MCNNIETFNFIKSNLVLLNNNHNVSSTIVYLANVNNKDSIISDIQTNDIKKEEIIEFCKK